MRYIILLIFATLSSNLSAQIYINELMSSNSSIIYDDFGESSDWIELYNVGEPINLGGYGLSDDLDDLYKWTFPSVTMNSNSHLLIFASGVGSDNNVQHSDGSNLYCSDCWENLEAIYPDNELI